MIIYKRWNKGYGFNLVKYEGWFLFGIIPLYIKIYK